MRKVTNESKSVTWRLTPSGSGCTRMHPRTGKDDLVLTILLNPARATFSWFTGNSMTFMGLTFLSRFGSKRPEHHNSQRPGRLQV